MIYPTLILLQQQQQGGDGRFGFVLMIVMIAIFYFLVFMPMQRQRRNTQKMQKGLENGNIVLTSGGLVGTIVALNPDDTVTLRIKPDNVKVQIARSAVTGLITEEAKKS
jgi:preprotein translocase subunit YajC